MHCPIKACNLKVLEDLFISELAVSHVAFKNITLTENDSVHSYIEHIKNLLSISITFSFII